jgi:hypothetical protein
MRDNDLLRFKTDRYLPDYIYLSCFITFHRLVDLGAYTLYMLIHHLISDAKEGPSGREYRETFWERGVDRRVFLEGYIEPSKRGALFFITGEGI